MYNLNTLEERLVKNIKNNCSQYVDVLKEAMIYSVSAGGKRIRPVLLLECYKLFSDNEDLVLDVACAIEYIHTYSLIHDDLPCMDDDDFRRGRPSCHKKFGEDIALLAGDALQSLAFKVISNCKLESSKIVKCIGILADYIGSMGMVGGQVIDLQSNNQVALDVVLKTYELKTAALIQASCAIGAILGGADEEDINKISQYAYNLGIAFQIKDDILDVIGNSDKLGKPVGSDEVNNKFTYLSFVGLEQAQKDVLEYSKKAKQCISGIVGNVDFLNNLVDKLIVREN